MTTQHPQTDEHLAGCPACMMAHDKALPDGEALDMEMFGELRETSIPDPEEQNEARSVAALTALIRFACDHGERPQEGMSREEVQDLLHQNAVDLIADLMHLDDRLPFMMGQDLYDEAQQHYLAESN